VNFFKFNHKILYCGMISSCFCKSLSGDLLYLYCHIDIKHNMLWLLIKQYTIFLSELEVYCYVMVKI
jgi:hypothetical protein